MHAQVLLEVLKLFFRTSEQLAEAVTLTGP